MKGQSMKVLVCGASGQLGQALQQSQPEGWTVTALDRGTLDITNAQQVTEQIQHFTPDLIINATAYTQVDRAESEPEQAFAVNAEGVRHLAEAACSIHARLIHVSTDFVFDGRHSQPYKVSDACQPLSVYGASKLAGEIALREVLPNDHLIVRTSWLYGVQGDNFVKTMLRLMRQGSALRVVRDQIGCPTWVDGLARVIWALADTDHFGRTLHWCDQGATSWYDFAVAIQEQALALGILQEPVSIQPIPSTDYPVPAKRPAYSVLDCADTVRLSGIPQQDWRGQLRFMLQQLVKTST